MRREFLLLPLAVMLTCWAVAADSGPAITFDHSFEAGSLGTIEKIGDTEFRLHVAGQYDERGRNRQPSWYYFRMDHVAGRNLVLTLTDLIGEYDDKPGAVPMSGNVRPVWSGDQEHWQHFDEMAWDNVRKEATLKFRPAGDTIWIAHQAPYPHSRFLRLLAEVDRSPHARIEVIGRTALGRELHMVTVTNFERADEAKKVVALQARQHAWESGTSFVMEGALRFIVSDDVRARELRDRTVFVFHPMVDPDGSATGGVRFNAHGYDLNRNWAAVDLRDKRMLQAMPEIWYVKKSLTALQARRPITFALNLHNDEMNEYMETLVDDAATLAPLRKLFATLAAETTFDPSRADVTVGGNAVRPTSNSLWRTDRVPIAAMEQRIGPGKKLGRRATTEDRLNFGRALVIAMGSAVP